VHGEITSTADYRRQASRRFTLNVSEGNDCMLGWIPKSIAESVSREKENVFPKLLLSTGKWGRVISDTSS